MRPVTAITVMLSLLLLIATTFIQAAETPTAKTYGLGLPRDLDVLAIPDTDYPDWVLRKNQAAYADVSGTRMKQCTPGTWLSYHRLRDLSHDA